MKKNYINVSLIMVVIKKYIIKSNSYKIDVTNCLFNEKLTKEEKTRVNIAYYSIFNCLYFYISFMRMRCLKHTKVIKIHLK